MDLMKELGCELCFKGWTLNTLLRSWYCRHWDPTEDCLGALCSIGFQKWYELGEEGIRCRIARFTVYRLL